MEITAQLKDKPESAVTINYPMPETLEALTSQFGADVVYNKAVDSIVIDVQSNMRRLIRKVDKEGKPTENAASIQEKLAKYVPTAASTVRRSPTEKASDLITKMTAEEKKALLDSLRAQLATA